MKLYYSKGACSLAPRIIINELGLPCEFVAVDLKTHQTHSGADFYQINPKGSVPVLELDSGEILTENAVILQYLADNAKNITLLPPVGDLKRYRVLEWLNFTGTDLHKGVGALFNPSYSESVRNEILIPNIKKKISYLDSQLGNKTFIAGNDLTLPDAYLFVIIRWLGYFKFNLQDWPNVSRYFENLQKHPSIQLSLQQESIV